MADGMPGEPGRRGSNALLWTVVLVCVAGLLIVFLVLNTAGSPEPAPTGTTPTEDVGPAQPTGPPEPADEPSEPVVPVEPSATATAVP